MKIDFDLLEKMADAGASAHSIIVMLKAADTKRAPKRTKDKAAKAAAAKAKREAKASENARSEAKVGESERKPTNSVQERLFGLRPRLVSLGLSPDRAGAMLGQWAKVTRDNVSAIETAIAGAELKGPADPIGYIRAVLQDRSSINGKRDATMDAFDRIIAGTSGEIAGDPPMRDITPRGG